MTVRLVRSEVGVDSLPFVPEFSEGLAPRPQMGCSRSSCIHLHAATRLVGPALPTSPLPPDYAQEYRASPPWHARQSCNHSCLERWQPPYPMIGETSRISPVNRPPWTRPSRCQTSKVRCQCSSNSEGYQQAGVLRPTLHPLHLHIFYMVRQ